MVKINQELKWTFFEEDLWKACCGRTVEDLREEYADVVREYSKESWARFGPKELRLRLIESSDGGEDDEDDVSSDAE